MSRPPQCKKVVDTHPEQVWSTNPLDLTGPCNLYSPKIPLTPKMLFLHILTLLAGLPHPIQALRRSGTRGHPRQLNTSLEPQHTDPHSHLSPNLHATLLAQPPEGWGLHLLSSHVCQSFHFSHLTTTPKNLFEIAQSYILLYSFLCFETCFSYAFKHLSSKTSFLFCEDFSNRAMSSVGRCRTTGGRTGAARAEQACVRESV